MCITMSQEKKKVLFKILVGGGGSGVGWAFGISSCKLLHLEWISDEVLLYSTGNYTISCNGT